MVLQFSIEVLLDIWPIWCLLGGRGTGGAAATLETGVNHYVWWRIWSSGVCTDPMKYQLNQIIALRIKGSMPEGRTLSSHSPFMGFPVWLALNQRECMPSSKNKPTRHAFHPISRLFLELSEQAATWGSAASINMNETVGVLCMPLSEGRQRLKIPKGWE